jgi:hypothetical protein
MASTTPVFLVFIDPAVEDASLMSSEIPAEAETITLDANRDGLEQMTEVLADCQGIDQLHIVSSGSLSSLQLGASYLTRFNLNRYGWHLQAWGEALAPHAQIVLHGCIAPSQQDITLSQYLSLLTGAKVMLASHESGSWIMRSQQNKGVSLPIFAAAKIAL